MTVNEISFPNIGLKMTLKEAAFTVFGREIYWYAIILTLGMVFAVGYVMYRRKFEKIQSDDIFDYAIFSIVLSIVGARLYYVLTSLDKYKDFWSVFKIWEGGLGFYGALIGGAVAVFFVARHKKTSVLKIYDMVAPGMMFAQAIGRWGNFVNGEAYGSNTMFEFFGKQFTGFDAGKLPWAMHIDEIRDGVAVSSVDCQPTFLYESLWNVLGFILINAFYKKKKFDGQVFFAYLAWYGFGRMFIEGMRTDSLYVGPIKISQLLGLVFFIAGTVLFFAGKKFLKLHDNSIKESETEILEAKAEPAVKTEKSDHTEETVEKSDVTDEPKTEEHGNGEDN